MSSDIQEAPSSETLKQCARIKDQLFHLRDKLHPVLPDVDSANLKEETKPIQNSPLLRELDDISDIISALSSSLSI